MTRGTGWQILAGLAGLQEDYLYWSDILNEGFWVKYGVQYLKI